MSIKFILQNYGIKLLLILLPFSAFPQWERGEVPVQFSMPEVALIDIEPGVNNRVHFTLLTAAESGTAPELVETTNASLWINYSSALPANQYSRSIMAEIAQGSLPAGIRLFLEASDVTGNREGEMGQSTGKTELTGQPGPIITGIGNGFTGDGIQNGHQLIFSIEIDDYTNIGAAGESYFVVVYTLTDN